MNKDSQKLNFSIDTLNKFAPKGVEFIVGLDGLIRTVLTDYKTKYPEIDQVTDCTICYDIFKTGFSLDDLEMTTLDFAGYLNEGVPFGFKNKKIKNHIMDYDIFSKVDMNTQTKDLDKYCCGVEIYTKLTNTIDEIHATNSNPKKSFWTNKITEIKNSGLEKELIDQRLGIKLKMIKLFYSLNFNPKGILAFAVRNAGQEMIKSLKLNIYSLQKTRSAFGSLIVTNYNAALKSPILNLSMASDKINLHINKKQKQPLQILDYSRQR